jgi:4-alpha-glucanotransferase
MSDDDLYRLGRAAGISASWKDVFGKTHDVAPPTLRAVLHALDLPASTGADIADSYARATALPHVLPPLVTADVGRPIALPAAADRYSLTLEDGRIFDGYAWDAHTGCTIPAILEPGYHRLFLGAAEGGKAGAWPRSFTRCAEKAMPASAISPHSRHSPHPPRGLAPRRSPFRLFMRSSAPTRTASARMRHPAAPR